MTAKNDITNDLIKSKISNEKYLNNYDKIFRNKKEKKETKPEKTPNEIIQ